MAIIDKPSDYFNTITYSGDGSSPVSVTGVGFQPDWVWVRRRNVTTPHVLYDAVRGTGKQLISNDTSAEATNHLYGHISAFESDGFEATAGGGGISRLYASGGTYVAWNWKANGTGVSNTDGTITSTVSANVDAGFSIVSYTANSGGNDTVGHGLSKAPEIVFWKSLVIQDWLVTSTLFNNPARNYLKLNLTNALADFGSDAYFHTTTTIDARTRVNDNNDNHIAYCFHSVEGYSKVGSYTGNGSTDGTFIYTGFKPAFVIIKRTDSTSSWSMRDTVRSPNNVVTNRLWSNLSSAESTSTTETIDILSNGFKCRNNIAGINASGGSYIFMCFASNPLVTSTGVPTTAR